MLAMNSFIQLGQLCQFFFTGIYCGLVAGCYLDWLKLISVSVVATLTMQLQDDNEARK